MYKTGVSLLNLSKSDEAKMTLLACGQILELVGLQQHNAANFAAKFCCKNTHFFDTNNVLFNKMVNFFSSKNATKNVA